MDEIKKGINPNFMPIFTQKIESKSTAIQYAIDTTVTFDEDGNKKINFDKAKEVFDFICQNVDLPDVPNGLFDNMDEKIKELKEQIGEKLSDTESCEELKKDCDSMSCTCEKKSAPVMERIKTFEDACRELGENHPFVVQYNEIFNNYLDGAAESNTCDIVAYLKLRIICAALNEGWEPQFTDDEYRYYPDFVLYAKKDVEGMDDKTKNELGLFGGIAFAGACCGSVAAPAYNDFGDALAYYGSRLCLRTRELSEYCGRQFFALWADFYLIRK